MTRKLKKHQLEAIKKIEQCMGQCGLFMAPGTGKTLTVIRYVLKHNLGPNLIVCRRDDYMTWRQELEAEGQPDYFCVESGDQHLPGYDYYPGGEALPRWYIVSYDLVKNPRIKDWIKSIPWEFCSADEVHYLKRHSAERTKQVIRATRHIPQRIGLTGSPITNEPLDCFSIAWFIDDGKTFGRNEWKFRHKFYLRNSFGPGWFRRKGARDRLAKMLAPMAFHVHEDDVLTLPPRRDVIEWCPMMGHQRRHYERLLNDWETELSSGKRVELDQAAHRIAKLKQIASGFIYDEDGKPVWMKSGKLNRLIDSLRDKDYYGRYDKVVVWASYTAEIEMILKKAKEKKINAVGFYGSHRRAKETARRRFRDDSKVRLFVGQVDAGVGINELTVAPVAIYFSNSFKVVSRQQSERRTRRIGSEHHDFCLYSDFVSEGTVDRGVLRSVKGMMSFAQSVLDKIKKGASIREILS